MPMTGAARRRRGVGQVKFDRALRFDLNPPRVNPHIYLTALARVVQWAGVYALRVNPLVRNGVLTILASPCACAHTPHTISRMHCMYTQISNRVSRHGRTRIAFLELSCTRTYVLSA